MIATLLFVAFLAMMLALFALRIDFVHTVVQQGRQ